jgi:alkylated DNA repair protein (DNA oxidative demethylase)
LPIRGDDLFAPLRPLREPIRPGMTLLRGFADPAMLLPHIAAIAVQAPFRHLVTPGGHTMSVAMTNCGPFGWVSDRVGYRYEKLDPLTGAAWPSMPAEFGALAGAAAEAGGFSAFEPDACLINRYAVGSRLTAHQDRDERAADQPIVSVSIGLPATFFVHDGNSRAGGARAVALASGDVVVFGGPARLAYHGVRDIRPGVDGLAGPWRYNLTFRRAGWDAPQGSAQRPMASV